MEKVESFQLQQNLGLCKFRNNRAKPRILFKGLIPKVSALWPDPALAASTMREAKPNALYLLPVQGMATMHEHKVLIPFLS